MKGIGADEKDMVLVIQDTIAPTDSINRQFLDLVRRLLTFDPQQRITVREALQHPYFSLHVPEEPY